jgi:hypothetical protein
MSLSLLGLRYSMSQYRAVQYTDTEHYCIKHSSAVPYSAVSHRMLQCSSDGAISPMIHLPPIIYRLSSIRVDPSS